MTYKNGLATNRLRATLDHVADAIRRPQPAEDGRAGRSVPTSEGRVATRIIHRGAT